MTKRVAKCACGRVQLTVANEPMVVGMCHCDFCQKRTGSVLAVQAFFGEDQVTTISGETRVYNGLEIDGVGSETGDEISYHFCTTCGSTVYWVADGPRGIRIGIAVGNFVDPDFPPPTREFYAKLRHRWLPPISVAERFEAFRPR
jgi:hypothetical protein